MRSVCLQCEQNGYSFVFSSDFASFQVAEENCKRADGSLASNLDRDTYLKFNKCCSNAPGRQFYLGLVANGQCNQNSLGQFQWVGSSKCNDGRPLNLQSFLVLPCQAATIITQINKSRLPTSLVLDCSIPQRYICQFRLNPTSFPTVPTTPTTEKSTKLPSSKIALLLSPTVASSFTPTIERATENKRSSGAIVSTSTTVSNDVASSNYVFIAGVVVGVVVLTFLLALFLCWVLLLKQKRTKKSEINQQLASSSSEGTVHCRADQLPEGITNHELPQSWLSILPKENNGEGDYAPANIQLDPHPYSISGNNVESKYENDRKFSIDIDPNACASINTEPTYLEMDDLDLEISDQNGKNYVELERNKPAFRDVNNQNIPHNAITEKTETVYLKPFN